MGLTVLILAIAGLALLESVTPRRSSGALDRLFWPPFLDWTWLREEVWGRPAWAVAAVWLATCLVALLVVTHFFGFLPG